MARYYEDLPVGFEFTTPRRTVTEADIVNFAGLSGDFNPLHTDDDFAATTPFGGRIAHGVLVLAMVTGLRQRVGLFEGTLLAFLEIRSWRFKGAVQPGDTITVRCEVTEKRETSRDDRGIVVQKVEAIRGHDIVQEGEFVLLMRRRGGADDGEEDA